MTSVGTNTEITQFIGKICPYCQFPIESTEAIAICPRCEMPHHKECWNANGGCTTFGCTAQIPVRQRVSPPRQAMPSRVDLSGGDLTLGSDAMPSPQRRQNNETQQPKPPLVSASESLGATLGCLGAVIGFIAGLGAGGIGCIPGAFVGFLAGSFLGLMLPYLLIVGATAGIGVAIGSSAGSNDAEVAGAVLGFLVGVAIILINRSSYSRRT